MPAAVAPPPVRTPDFPGTGNNSHPSSVCRSASSSGGAFRPVSSRRPPIMQQPHQPQQSQPPSPLQPQPPQQPQSQQPPRSAARISALERTIEYMQGQHATLVKGLHEEIARLQVSCSDLSLQLVKAQSHPGATAAAAADMDSSADDRTMPVRQDSATQVSAFDYDHAAESNDSQDYTDAETDATDAGARTENQTPRVLPPLNNTRIPHVPVGVRGVGRGRGRGVGGVGGVGRRLIAGASGSARSLLLLLQSQQPAPPPAPQQQQQQPQLQQQPNLQQQQQRMAAAAAEEILLAYSDAAPPPPSSTSSSTDLTTATTPEQPAKKHLLVLPPIRLESSAPPSAESEETNRENGL